MEEDLEVGDVDEGGLSDENQVVYLLERKKTRNPTVYPEDPHPCTSTDLANTPSVVHQDGNIDEHVVINMIKEGKERITGLF